MVKTTSLSFVSGCRVWYFCCGVWYCCCVNNHLLIFFQVNFEKSRSSNFQKSLSQFCNTFFYIFCKNNITLNNTPKCVSLLVATT